MSSKGFSQRVIAAREKKGWPRSALTFAMHAAGCKVKHEEPYKKSSWPAACIADAEAIYKAVGSVEAGKSDDPEVEAAISAVLFGNVAKAAAKKAPAKAKKPKAAPADDQDKAAWDGKEDIDQGYQNVAAQVAVEELVSIE